MNQTMNQTTLTRKSILAAACFCFATSLAAQTSARQESTSSKEIATAQEPQIVASLTHPASIPAMPVANPNAATPAPDHSPTESVPVKLLASLVPSDACPPHRQQRRPVDGGDPGYGTLLQPQELGQRPTGDCASRAAVPGSSVR